MSFRRVEKLGPEHDTSAFDCGTPETDCLRRFALASQQADSARTFVVCEQGSPAVVGYYALAAGAVERASAPARVALGQLGYPIPVILLARLAVDRQHQGKGLGVAPLKDALTRAAGAADQIGVRAVLVHARDEQARAFYEKYDFEPSPVDDLQLCLLMKDLHQMLRNP